MHRGHTSDPAAGGSAVLSPPDGHEPGGRGKLVFLSHVSFSSSLS